MIIGIDPGASGALAFLSGDDGVLMRIYDMPTVGVKVDKSIRQRLSPQLLTELLRGWNPEMVVIESVGGITGQSASAAFTFGHSCGLIQGVVVGLGYPISMLPPQRWKKAAHLPADKGAARQRAQQLWPGHASLFARVKDDGRAEAALIARHYWQNSGRALAA